VESGTDHRSVTFFTTVLMGLATQSRRSTARIDPRVCRKPPTMQACRWLWARSLPGEPSGRSPRARSVCWHSDSSSQCMESISCTRVLSRIINDGHRPSSGGGAFIEGAIWVARQGGPLRLIFVKRCAGKTGRRKKDDALDHLIRRIHPDGRHMMSCCCDTRTLSVDNSHSGSPIVDD
jgi:hypothetical protein